MLSKYGKYFTDIYEYICNRAELKVQPEVIASEVFSKYHMELAFYDVSNEMMHEFILQMCYLGSYSKNGDLYE